MRVSRIQPGMIPGVLIAGALLLSPARSATPERTGPILPQVDPVSEPEPSAAGGTLTGVVRFGGAYRPPQTLRTFKDSAVCGTFRRSQRLLLWPQNNGLKNVLVVVDGAAGDRRASPDTAITIRVKKCRYVPHLQVAEIGPKGIRLRVLNEDGILHNVHAYRGMETLYNLAQPRFRKEISLRLTTPGIITLRCDVHRWMNAYVLLLRNQPFYAVTDQRGEFTIPHVPAGSYTLRTWHEALGIGEKQITVAEKKTTAVNLVLRPGGED